MAVAAEEKRTGHVLYWHLGNEINSVHYSRALGKRSGGGAPGMRNDPSYIPLFVERYLAPAVQSLTRARKVSGEPVPIVLGSVTNAHDPRARRWLDSLLNYTIEGTAAPELAGKKVYQVVDFISYHYTIDAPDWRESLDDLSRWMGRGSIRGMFDTEEIGNQVVRRSLAAATALLGFARYMSWWQARGYGPAQVRVNYWATGGAPGRTKDDAMGTLYDFLGDVPLESFASPTVAGSGRPESYQFGTPDGSKRILVVLAPAGSVSLRAVDFRVPSADGAWSARVHVFSRSGHTWSAASVSRESTGGYQVVPASPVALLRGEAALVELSRSR
jgi:hypothetical protein